MEKRRAPQQPRLKNVVTQETCVCFCLQQWRNAWRGLPHAGTGRILRCSWRQHSQSEGPSRLSRIHGRLEVTRCITDGAPDFVSQVMIIDCGYRWFQEERIFRTVVVNSVKKLILGAPDSLLLPSWQSQCSHSSSLSSASRSPLSLPEYQKVFTFWMSVPQVCPSTSTWSLAWTLPSWLLTNGSDKEYCASLTLHVASIGFFFLETHIMLSAMLDPNAFRHRVWDHTNKSIS